MFFDKIIHGTQYYRAPTPLPDEWEEDIKNLGEYNIDAFQIRINWRWNERKEGEYDFSDVDRLLELAEKNNRKVIMKFLLECAPQYVFDKYGGTRIGPRGEELRGGSHGAFYGGWRPCFTNPNVMAAAVRFVEKVAERYSDNKNIILWNTWNEIRNRPVEECFCPHCRAAFGKYLKNKFGTIEKLNSFYGAAEESFEAIALPATPHGYWDTYEFKKFKGSAELYNWLKYVYDGIRKYDKKRPIMAHVGVCSAFQSHIGDVSDDFTTSKAVDFFGTSVPFDFPMDSNKRRLDFLKLNDYLRAVDENYFVHEIYPGLGMFKRYYDTPFDMNFKLYTALSSGAKGLVYWQYRAERVGHENDCAGLVRADGSPREVTYAVKDFGAELNKNMDYFVGAKVEKAEVAIVFDFDSLLISEIEDASTGPNFRFDSKAPDRQYFNAHTGMYHLLKSSDYNVDYISATQPEKFADYKVLYFPNYTMLNPEITPYLQKFMENGGTVIADEGFGLRQTNTWMNPYDINCKPIMTARMRERRRVADEEVSINGHIAKISPYKSEYRVENGDTIVKFNDGTPAIQSVKYGKGKLYLCGIPIGYSYLTTEDCIWKELIGGILDTAGISKYKYSDFENEIYEKRLTNGDTEIIFIFNNSDQEKQFEIDGEIVTAGAFGTVADNVLTVPAKSQAYVVKK